MSLFRKKAQRLVSPEAKKAREEANEEYSDALAKLEEAKQLGNDLANIRAKNHFAESLTDVFGGKKHGH